MFDPSRLKGVGVAVSSVALALAGFSVLSMAVAGGRPSWLGGRRLDDRRGARPGRRRPDQRGRAPTRYEEGRQSGRLRGPLRRLGRRDGARPRPARGRGQGQGQGQDRRQDSLEMAQPLRQRGQSGRPSRPRRASLHQRAQAQAFGPRSPPWSSGPERQLPLGSDDPRCRRLPQGTGRLAPDPGQEGTRCR